MVFLVKNAGVMLLFITAILCFSIKAGKFVKDTWA